MTQLIYKVGIDSKIYDFLTRCNFKTILRGTLLISIIAYLFYQLTKIGWSEILHTLPSSPLFYILSIGTFLTPVIAEMMSFRMITANKFPISFKFFARKHVLNKAVLSYSGEAYLTQHLSTYENLSLKNSAIIIKDQALIRTFVANLWVIILVVTALAFGNRHVLQEIATASPSLVIAVSFICVAICLIAVLFFKKLSNLSYALGAKVTGVFLLRSAIFACILVSQWSLAIPGTDLSTWFLFLVIFILSRKSPVGGEFVFASIAVTLPGLSADNASIAAMLVSIIALNQINYLIAFILTSDFGKLLAKIKSLPYLTFGRSSRELTHQLTHNRL